MTDASLNDQVHFLENVLHSLENNKTIEHKVCVLQKLSLVEVFLKECDKVILEFIEQHSSLVRYVIYSLVAIGQAGVILQKKNGTFSFLAELVEQLVEVEHFYTHAGGIIGYHKKVLELILENKKGLCSEKKRIDYLQPVGPTVNEEDQEMRSSIREGIEKLPLMGEIYPLGGAGDRLNLIDPENHRCLPAAFLPFLGRTLLEGLVRDIQAREYVFFKCFKKQVVIPLAIMTSREKNNHKEILQFFQSKKWLGRDEKTICFFLQPLVPVLTDEGNWCLNEDHTLFLKPCGHGVLWKLMKEQDIFEWFFSQGISYCLIRQINNPLGGNDHYLSALAGWGIHKKKKFGFLSCERLLHAAEGTNVVIQEKEKSGFSYTLTNIEYTDFSKRGVEEAADEKKNIYSCFPANTNILFVDLKAAHHLLEKEPLIPGQLLNMKSTVPYIDSSGQRLMTKGGRLESTMQNIADYFKEYFCEKIDPKFLSEELKTFIVYGKRESFFSTTKTSYNKKTNPQSTPEQAYYDQMKNHHHLLEKCGFDLPILPSFEQYLKQGPSVIFIFHPALGPFHSVIQQKIRGGKLCQGAELQLEIAEVDLQELFLDGTLLIESSQPLGRLDNQHFLKYGRASRCSLHRVRVSNQGIEEKNLTHFWKNYPQRKEKVKIFLHEGAEFHAEDVEWIGSRDFEVPAGHRLTIKKNSEKLEEIEEASWDWEYFFDQENKLHLKKKERCSSKRVD